MKLYLFTPESSHIRHQWLQPSKFLYLSYLHKLHFTIVKYLFDQATNATNIQSRFN